jgi:hypothetical protein
MGAYLASLPADSAILASGGLGALGFSLLLLAGALFLGALLNPQRRA